MSAQRLIEGEFSDHMAKIKAIADTPTLQKPRRRFAWSPEKVAQQRERLGAQWARQHNAKLRTESTARLSYGPLKKLESGSYRRMIYCQGCEAYEAANALEKLGFSVMHPSTHPNGSGGIPAMVFIDDPKTKLPSSIPLP